MLRDVILQTSVDTFLRKEVAPNVFIISICLGNLVMEACIKFTIPKTLESKNSMNNVYT